VSNAAQQAHAAEAAKRTSHQSINAARGPADASRYTCSAKRADGLVAAPGRARTAKVLRMRSDHRDEAGERDGGLKPRHS
jgi:hypothetical protein